MVEVSRTVVVLATFKDPRASSEEDDKGNDGSSIVCRGARCREIRRKEEAGDRAKVLSAQPAAETREVHSQDGCKDGKEDAPEIDNVSKLAQVESSCFKGRALIVGCLALAFFLLVNDV